MTIADKSNCEETYGVDELDSCCCEAGENNLDLDSTILLFILFIIALISSLKLFIIAYRTLIVTDNSTVAT